MIKQTLTKIKEKGFTLIELLVVIAVLGVLAAAIIAAIDPVEKIRQANDSRVKGDINTIAKALEIYATTHNGAYPPTTDALVAGSDLKAWPKPPGDYSDYLFGAYPARCTSACTSVLIRGAIKSKATKPYTYWFYQTLNGRVCGWYSVGGAGWSWAQPCID